jgi:O-antigen/teichoic acid export membrane protein
VSQVQEQVGGGTWVAGGMVVLNVAAYGFTVAAARLLVPHEFGAVTALLGVLLLGNVAALGLQATTARRIAVGPEHRDAVVRSTLEVAVSTAVVLGGLVVVLSPALAALLRLDSAWPVALCGLALVPMTITGAQLGIAQGTERWQLLAVVYAALGLGRLVGGVVGLLLRDDPTGAMLGVAVGAWVPVVVGAGLLRPGGRHTASHRRSFAREALGGSHALLATLALSNADALVARNLLTTHDSGLYAAGLILTKAALFLPQFVSVVLYPDLARDHTRRSRARAVLIVVGIGAVATAATAALPRLALVLAGGDQYAEVADRLWLFALAGSALAVVNLLVLDALARHAHGVVVLVWAALVILLAVAYGLGVGLTGLVVTVGAVASLLAVVVWWAPGRRRTPAATS